MKKLLAVLALCLLPVSAMGQTAAQSDIGFLLAQGSTYGSFTCPAAATSPCFVQYGSAVPVTGTVTPSPVPDATQATGNITNNGDSVILTTTGGYSTVGISVSGTWSGTLQVSASQDCTTYAVTTALPLASDIPLSVISSNGAYQANFAGLKCFKIAGLSMVSGTAAIKISAGVGTGPVMQDNVPWIIGGYTTGASSTGSTATVKAASTVPATTDTSLVVATSPNSAVPLRTLVTLDVKTVTTGGTAVTALTAGHRNAGGLLCNPQGATINLGINEIGTAAGTTSSGDTTFIVPGQCYVVSPASTAVSVITSDSSHPFSGYGLN